MTPSNACTAYRHWTSEMSFIRAAVFSAWASCLPGFTQLEKTMTLFAFSIGFGGM